MFDNESAAEALIKGLDDLEGLTRTVQEKYDEALARKDYPVVVEPTVEERLEALKRAKYPHLLDPAAGEAMVE